MLIPPIFDDRSGSLSRLPPQSGQAVNVTKPCLSTQGAYVRLHGLDVLGEEHVWIFRGFVFRPSYVRVTPSTLIFVGSL